MQGNESFQISGDVSEENLKNNEEEIDESAQIEEDLETITSQTGVSKEIAAIELEKNNGDIAETIISLKKKK
jgi:NACalpha-BTF3-like transcription factor